MSDERDPVAKQYDEWPYPKPSIGLEPPFAQRSRIERRLYWPSGAPEGPLDILVAGCGTNQAAVLAQQNPDARVVGIDVSETSIKHERFLKMSYELANLTLQRHRIEDVAGLGSDFDLILSHGVLHHLHDPDEGLRALRDVLRPHGSIGVMLYGKHGRSGLAPVKELLGKLGLDQTEEDAGLAQEILRFLPETHPASGILGQYEDAGYKSGVIDALLHRRDRDYTVGDCLAYVDRCGLKLQRWTPNRWYYPDAHVPRDHPLYAALDGLGERELWSAMDLLLGNSKHQFLACREERDTAGYTIDFSRDASLDYVPRKTPGATGEDGSANAMSLDVLELKLFSLIDGEKTIRELAPACGFIGGDAGALETNARDLLRRLWRAGLVDIEFEGQR